MLRKFATAAVLDVRRGEDGIFTRVGHRAVFNYVPRPGYLYVRSRAISSRCNDNYDMFPAPEIEAAWRTFIGKPVFVNHYNSDHRRARGVIIDAALHRDRNPDGSPDTWVEVLQEVDGIRYPKLAKALLSGEIDRTSMGCDVQLSKCSVCGNEATSPLEYCHHIPGKKGQRIYQVQPDGRKIGKLVYEECRGLAFFENSLLVEPPADPTAYFLGNVETGPGLEHLASLAGPHPATSNLATPGLPGLTPPVHAWPTSPASPSVATPNLGGPCLPHRAASLQSTGVWSLLNQAAHDDELPVREAVKPQKPVSQMSDEEYGQHQEAVAKGNAEGKQWNVDHPISHKHIVDHWNRATPDEKANGENWYRDAHHLARHIANDTGHEMHTMAGLMSNYSPQTHWATNIMNAAKVARTRQGMGGPGSGIMATTRQKSAADRMLGGEHYDSVLAGPKTKAFAHLIEHGGNSDPSDPKVVVDRHALSVATGARATDNAYSMSRLGTKSRYNEASQAYHKAAKAISKSEGRPIEAHQVQAATWLVRQRLNEQHDADLSAKASTSRSGTRARGAIKEWNEYAAEHHPGAMGKEPGTGYSAAPEDLKHAKEMGDEGKTITKVAGGQYIAYGETKAPADVNTLRDESCPICGNETAFNGRECQVCGYIAPPKPFDDPDVEKAKQLDDLKQGIDDQLLDADPSRKGAPVGDDIDAEQAALAGDDEASPTLVCDNCGAEMRPATPTTGPDTDPTDDATATGPTEGDTCPVCGVGQLVSSGQSEDENTDGVPDADEQPDVDEGQLPPDDEDGEEDDGDPQDANPPEDDEDDENPLKKGKLPASKSARARKYRQPGSMTEGEEYAMRPTLQALAEQQKIIDKQSSLIEALLHRDAVHTSQIRRVTAGLATLAMHAGAEVEGQVKVAMLRRQADEQNPAQPVPEPTPEPPSESTVQTKTPEAFADVTAPGMVPGSNNDVAADAVSTAYTPGQDLPSPAVRQLVDVTKPIDGTQGPRPLNETKTEVDVRAGNGMNPQVAFPLTGPYSNAQRTGSMENGRLVEEDPSVRVYAAQRLARLRIQAGIAELNDDLALGARIAQDETRSTAAINAEIETLTSVAKVAGQRPQQHRATDQPAARPGLVPRAAAVQRTVPSMASTAAAPNGRENIDADVESIFLSSLT
jgi:hypothetical protein